VPCPHCHEHQTLELQSLHWPEGRPREAEYACTHCGSLIGERHKTWMLEHGEWRATADGNGRTAGFHLSSLYSPVGWFSWADAAEMYEQAKKTPDLMKGFVNTVLGLPFEEEAEAPEWQRLYERRENYRIGLVPEGGLFVTAGVDVQKDRIEVEVVAWGRGKESWSVDYRVIEGDTARAEVWAKLDMVLARDWPHASGHTLPIRVMCVDAGYATQDIYAWVRQHPQASWGPAGAAARQPRTAVAVKGRDRDTALLLSVSRADAGGKRRGLRVWSVGTPVAKGELYRWLKLEWPTEEALDAGRPFRPAPATSRSTARSTSSNSRPSGWSPASSRASRGGRGRRSPAGVRRRSTAASTPAPRPRSTVSTGSRSGTGGGWRRPWRGCRTRSATGLGRTDRHRSGRRHGG
jgi:phage terminase large subunit GpA-like protein